MLSFRSSVIFIIMVGLFISLAFGGQNANAKVAIDLYTAMPNTDSN